jgi:START domain-containing protein
MKCPKLLWLVPLLAVAAPSQAASTDWELVKSSDGIVVDRRVVSGSPLKEFRGRGVIDAPIADILAVFSDVGRATEWMDSCNGSRVVDDVSERVKVVYNRTHAPWPVSDRDAVLRNVVTIDDDERRVAIDFTAIDDTRAPAVKGVVRMPFVRGHWYLWPAADGKSTRVEYQVHASPGGALPNWIVNYVSRDLPHKTVAGLRAQVKRRRYPDFQQQLRVRFPEHPFLVAPAVM